MSINQVPSTTWVPLRYSSLPDSCGGDPVQPEFLQVPPAWLGPILLPCSRKILPDACLHLTE